MRNLMLILFLVFLGTALCAQTPVWEWAVQGGSPGTDYPWDICTDAEGSSYVTGYFNGTADFGGTTLVSSGSNDVFVAKLDSNGNYLWAVSGGGSGGEMGMDIAINSNYEVYITGTFSSPITFGSTTLSSNGQNDAFVAKLDAGGNWIWAVNAGGAYYDQGWGICTDNDGNCIVTGHYSGTVLFGSTTLTSATSWGDIWVAKINTLGAWVWASGAGSETGQDRGYEVDCDAAGNVYLTGSFEGTAYFGTSMLVSPGGLEAFVARLDSNGNWDWVVQAGGIGGDYSQAIACDAEGNCTITGTTSSEDAYFGSILVHGDSWESSIFVARLDSNGDFLWACTAGSGWGADEGLGVDVDTFGNAFVTGYFEAEAYFGSLQLTSSGAKDVFVAKLDSSGAFLWAEKAGSSYYLGDSGKGIAVVPGVHVLVTGSFATNALFGPLELSTGAQAQIFVASLYDEAPMNPPGPVTLLAPTDGAMNIPLEGYSFTWEPDWGGGDPEHFVFYLSNDPEFIYEQMEWEVWGFSFDPTQFGMVFSQDQTWYWTVKAVNAGGEAVVEPPHSFTCWSYYVVTELPVIWEFEEEAFPPEGWTSEDEDETYPSWFQESAINHTGWGVLSASHGRSTEAPSQNGWLITPPIAIPEGANVELSFWNNNWFQDTYFSQGVYANTTNDPNAAGWQLLWSPPRVGEFWLPEFINLSSYGGQVVYFAFVYQGYDANVWVIDDVSIYLVNPVTEFPVVWDFEDGLYPPLGWTSADLDYKETCWQNSENDNHTEGGSHSALHPYSTLWGEDPGQNGWLISPPISVPTEGSWAISFWEKIIWLGWYHYNGVLVNTVNDPLDPNWTQIWEGSYVDEEWNQSFVGISAYRGQTVYFAFIYQGYDAHDWYLDDISIVELGIDTEPPVITYLPHLSTPRTDIPLHFSANVSDDPLYQSAIAGVNLHWKRYGEEYYSTQPMEHASGNEWFCALPPQPLNVSIEYYYEAWDEWFNYSDTQPYNWFDVVNPAWLSYDAGGTHHLGVGDRSFGVANVYDNPYYSLNQPVKILSTGCGTNLTTFAELHLYAFDGETLSDAMEPMLVELIEGQWITYTDLEALNVTVSTQYFVVAYENIPSGVSIWFDNTYDYGRSYLITGTTLEAMPESGSWVLPAYVTNGALQPPVITIRPLDWFWEISWEHVPGAGGYNLLGSNDPYSATWTLLQTTPDNWCYYQEPEPMQFFMVTSLSELPAQAKKPYGHLPVERFKQRKPAARQMK